MRFSRFAWLVSLSGSLVSAAACGGAGGGGAGDGVKSPSAAAPDSPGAGAAAIADAGPPTTTSLTLGDGGDLQGAKLSETHTVTSSAAAPAGSGSGAAAPAGSGSPLKNGHAHEAGRNPEDIRAIIMSHRDEARACYDSSVKDHPGIEGDLVIQWTIDPKGNVTQTAIDASRSQIVEPTVVACISDVIKKLQFASSPGGFETKAFYPFNFHPHHGSAPKSP